MDALLILGGILLVLVALVWVVMLAFETSLLWGWGSLIPPITLIFVVRHWRKARKAIVLAGLGVVPLVVGLALMAANDSERLAAILSLKWLQPEPKVAQELNIQLRGELNDQPFAPQQAELIDGTLSLREGQDFYARRELSIRLPESSKSGVKVDVLPQDTGPLPSIELSWLLPEQDLPEARRIDRGYTLHLDLQPVAPNKLVGDFHLVLPSRYHTTLSGTLELYTDRLRYRDGVIDARHDSRETLAWVIKDYLQRRFATPAVSLAVLPPVSFAQPELSVEVEAMLSGQPQTLIVHLVKNPQSGWVVKGDQYPQLSVVAPALRPLATNEPALEPTQVEVATQPDRRPGFSLQRLLQHPADYRNLTMRLLTVRGSSVEGRFVGVNSGGRLLIRSLLSGAGEASFSVQPSEVERIELLEP